MNTQHGEGNTEIPEVEDIVIEDGDDAETIKTKVSDYKAKVDERNAQLFVRTKKAEGFEQKDGKWVKVEKPTTEPKVETPAPASNDKLSSLDVIAIMNGKVPEEDITDVVEFAAFKKISVAEALKTPMMKTMLAEKAEFRKTAEGSQTGSQRRGSGKVSDETLLENAGKGQMPESPEDMGRLAALRFKGLKKK